MTDDGPSRKLTGKYANQMRSGVGMQSEVLYASMHAIGMKMLRDMWSNREEEDQNKTKAIRNVIDEIGG